MALFANAIVVISVAETRCIAAVSLDKGVRFANKKAERFYSLIRYFLMV